MNREILDQIIDEIIKNDRRSTLQAAPAPWREAALPAREAAWNAWVPEIARKSPVEALNSLGSSWNGLAQPTVDERLKAWGPNHLPQGGRRPRGLSAWLSRWSLRKAAPGQTYVIRSRDREDREARPLWVSPDELAPGDVVLLSAGETVPADVRLLRVREFRVDERVLTGNGRPVAKAARWDKAGSGPFGIADLAYGGTRVVAGTATGVVVATGDGMLLAILGRA